MSNPLLTAVSLDSMTLFAEVPSVLNLNNKYSLYYNEDHITVIYTNKDSSVDDFQIVMDHRFATTMKKKTMSLKDVAGETSGLLPDFNAIRDMALSTFYNIMKEEWTAYDDNDSGEFYELDSLGVNQNGCTGKITSRYLTSEICRADDLPAFMADGTYIELLQMDLGSNTVNTLNRVRITTNPRHLENLTASYVNMMVSFVNHSPVDETSK